MKILKRCIGLCCVLLSACHSNTPVHNSTPVIDGNATAKADISELFAEINAAPLQTTDSSLVGGIVINVKRSGNRLFMLNQVGSHANLLCFDTTGKFIYTLDRIGHGPQEYTYLGDFMTDPGSDTMVLATEKGKYMVFDTVGNYISTIWQQPPYYYDRQFIRTNDSTYVVYHNGHFPKGSDLLEVDSRTFAIRKSAQATDILASEGARPLSYWNGRLLYYNMNDTIYDATDIQKQKPLYYLDFGEDQRKSEDDLRETYVESRDKALALILDLLRDKKYTFVFHFFENQRWIAISAMKQDPEAKKDAVHAIPFFVLYDKETGRSYNSDYISWDILNLGPLKNIDIVGCDDRGTLYALWYGIPSDSEKQKIGRGDKLPQEVKDKLSRRTDEDNPVLFMLR